MVNNYPEYAAGVNYKKTDTNGDRHFYSAQVVADPANETVESKLIKDGVVIDEGGATVEALNVTENGTYSEEGKAYSPVVVNVAGGASDLRTATVTIIGGASGLAISGGIDGTTEGYLFIKSTEYGDTGVTAVGAPAATTITPKAILFKDLSAEVPHDFTALFSVVDGTIASVAGNCEIYEETSVLVWGDCTITAN